MSERDRGDETERVTSTGENRPTVAWPTEDGTTEQSTDRRRFLAGLGTAAVAGLAGCGADGGDASETAPADSVTDSPDQTATDRQTATPTPEPVEFAPFWTTGEKVGFGTARTESAGSAGDQSTDESDDSAGDSSALPGGRVWYTLTRGALTGVRFPRIDLLNVRRLDFLVTDGEYAARTAELDRRVEDDVSRSVSVTDDRAPAYRHEFAGKSRDWSLTVEYAPDPDSETVLLDVTVDLPDGFDCYAVCRPAVTTGTEGDSVTRRTTNGDPVVTVTDDSDGGVVKDTDGDTYDVSVALAADPGFQWASAAPVPSPETARLLQSGEEPTESREATENSALVGRLDGNTTLAVGFAGGPQADGANGPIDPTTAVEQARSALADGFDTVSQRFHAGWASFHEDTTVPESVADDEELATLYRRSLTVLAASEDDTFHGAGVASPCVPWGDVILAETPGDVGYHYVWARDLYQSFTAYEAAGRTEHARAAVEYLFEYQRREGGFLPQNTFLDGRTRWGGEQLDQIAFPLVMVRQLLGETPPSESDLAVTYPQLAASADYVLSSGPETEQERWEEESGLSPSTIAAEIAGLVSAAGIAHSAGEPADELVWLLAADEFRAGVQEWVVTREGTDRHDPPYYYRIGGNTLPDDGSQITLANGGRTFDERNVIDAGFLELVRLGVLPADDPVIESSVAVVDDSIRVETPHGPGFYRYTGDGYGEGVDGAPYPVVAETLGRLWPLLTAERAEYELAAGTTDGATAPTELLSTLAGFANDGGLLPEQVWDREDPTEFGWAFGEGTGSATPLSWSHAAFVRLAEEIDAGEPLATPEVVGERYDDGPPAKPSLDVEMPDTTVEASTVEIGGQTDAPAVAVAVGGDARLLEPTDGEFRTTVELQDGRNTVVVAAGDPDAAPASTGVAGERADVSVV